MAEGDEEVIATIPKNSREELRITLREYKGVKLVSLRVWFKAADGSMRPGSDGVAMRVSCLADLASAMAKAAMTADANGWLS